MTLRADVFSVLSGSTSVTSLVGTRIARQTVPQGWATPYIAYRKVGAPRMQALNNGPTGEEEARVEVACFGGDPGEAENVAEAVRGAMSGWRDLTLGVEGSDMVGEIDLFDPELEAYQISLDFQIMHTE